MSTRQPASIPIALSTARHQFDHWRSQQPNKRTRLPKELWRQAVALAKEHGLNKTARALNVKYYSLKKHLDETGADDLMPTISSRTFTRTMPRPKSRGCLVLISRSPKSRFRRPARLPVP